MTVIDHVRPILLSAPYGNIETNLESKLHLTSGYRTTGLVEVTLSDGTSGLGEGYAAVFAPRVFEQMIHLLKPYLIGKDIMNINGLYRELKIVTGYWSLQGAAQHALSAVEIALQDCRGKLFGLPVYQLLGGALNERRIRLYGSGGDSTDPDSMSQEFDYLQKLGISEFKIRSRKEKARQAVWCLREGRKRGIAIAIDMGQNLQFPGQAAADFLAFEEQVTAESGNTVSFFEEVLGPANLQDYRLLRQKAKSKIAGGEIVTTVEELNQRIHNGYYDIVQPDATVIGGIGPLMEVFSSGRQTATNVVVHCWGGPVGMMANYHAAVAGGGQVAEWPMTPYELRDHMIVAPWKIDDGLIEVSDAPGLGVFIDDELENRFPFREDAVYGCLPQKGFAYQAEIWE